MLKILIIDDNESFRETLATDLRDYPQTAADIAPNAVDGIIQMLSLATPPYTDIIIDYKLELGNAVTLLKAFKNRVSLPHCWLVSGNDQLPENIKNNFQAVFNKPVKTLEIYNQLLLASHQAQVSQIPSAIKKLPLPIRVINSEGICIYKNELWTWDVAEPAPHYDREGQEPRNISIPDLASLETKTWCLHSSPLDESLQLDICEAIEKTAIDICGSKEQYFKYMKEIGFPRGRFYEIITTPNRKGQPQQKLYLCAVSEAIKAKNKAILSEGYEYPLNGCLLKRMERHQPGTPRIVSIAEDDKDDPGIIFWDNVIAAENLHSWLEIPLFDHNIQPPKLCAVMIFDQQGSKRIGDDANKALVNPNILEHHRDLFQRIIDDAEEKMARHVDEQHFELMKKLEVFDLTVQTATNSGQLLQEMLNLAITLCEVDEGLILKPQVATGTIEVIAASHTLKRLTDGIAFPMDKTMPFFRDFSQRVPVYFQDVLAFIKNSKVDYLKCFPNADDAAAFKAEQLKNWYEQGLKASVSLPIQSGEHFFGIINLLSTKKTYCFEQAHIDIVNTLIQRTIGYLALKKTQEDQKNWQLAIAHEIRSDTAPILQSLDFFEPQQQQLDNRYIRRITRHTTNIKDLAENMFIIESDLIPPESNFTGFYGDVGLLCGLLSDEAEFNGKIIDFPLLQDPLSTLWAVKLCGEKDKFLRVIRVLLDNAISHSKEQANIAINLSIDDGFMIFTVTNSGTIDKNDLAHIFDPFYQLSFSSKPRIRVGLAAAKKIVQAVGGDLEITPCLVDDCISTSQKCDCITARMKWPIIL